MKASSVLVVALASAVLASPAPSYHYKEHRGWAPPGPGDVRSPCPLLDSLANHDIIPHSGKDITIPILKEAFLNYINVGHDVAVAVGDMGLALSKKKNSFNLDELDLHNAIEHDGSISRDDFYFGNDHTFNGTIFDQAARFFQGPTITPKDAATARITRHKTAKSVNPDYMLSKAHRLGSFTEQAFYLSIFGNSHTGIVPKAEWVTYWFRQRRLPYALGWSPRMLQTNLTTLAALSKLVHENNPKPHMDGDDDEWAFYVH